MGRIADSHDELYHYTTAAGISGILQSKSLWATHTSFVNDDEEILGFYDRVLPKILRPVFHKYIEDIKDQAEFRKQQGNTPLELYCEEQFAKLMQGFRRAASLWHDHYITSFTTTTDDWVREHGLLSQWRAYGPNGGYALVFDTAPLDKILSEETTRYQEERYVLIRLIPLSMSGKTICHESGSKYASLPHETENRGRFSTLLSREKLLRVLTG